MSIQAANSKSNSRRTACDLCRKRKVRCAHNPSTSIKPRRTISKSKTRDSDEGPSTEYVELLENRVEQMEDLLLRRFPNVDFTEELGIDIVPHKRQKRKTPQHTTSYADNCGPNPCLSLSVVASALRQFGDDSDVLEQEEDKLHVTMQGMCLGTNRPRFFGPSSRVLFVKNILEMKDCVPLELAEISLHSVGRRQFWTGRPWEMKLLHHHETPIYVFPEDDLLWSLVSLYFEHANAYLPLLHRPTFERSIRDGLHVHNSAFGGVLLLVCAVASWWSNDPRVFFQPGEPQSCGWTWFKQVKHVKPAILQPPCLYDLQMCCLFVQYIQYTSSPGTCWRVIGLGLRLAQDAGEHRRDAHRMRSRTENELWKRAVWVLVFLDRASSCVLGRAPGIYEEDFDLDFPTECDDEYWEHPETKRAFKQPPDKPSKVTYFVHFLKLMRLMAITLRTLYAIHKPGSPDIEESIVAELDSALNKWKSSIPDHLRWDPNRENALFFNQSSLLHCSYHHTEMLVHRPFIAFAEQHSPMSFSSWAICRNAARSCVHVLDIQAKRYPQGNVVIYQDIIAFSSSLVLLMAIWEGERSGTMSGTKKDVAEVHMCMQAIKLRKDRFPLAARMWDILADLVESGDVSATASRSTSAQPGPQETRPAPDSIVVDLLPTTPAPAAVAQPLQVDYWQPSAWFPPDNTVGVWPNDPFPFDNSDVGDQWPWGASNGFGDGVGSSWYGSFD